MYTFLYLKVVVNEKQDGLGRKVAYDQTMVIDVISSLNLAAILK
jgi:hypothetical protein